MCKHDPQLGRSGSTNRAARCLLCETARLFRGWRYPASARAQRRAAGRATAADARQGEYTKRWRVRRGASR